MWNQCWPSCKSCKCWFRSWFSWYLTIRHLFFWSINVITQNWNIFYPYVISHIFISLNSTSVFKDQNVSPYFKNIPLKKQYDWRCCSYKYVIDWLKTTQTGFFQKNTLLIFCFINSLPWYKKIYIIWMLNNPLKKKPNLRSIQYLFVYIYEINCLLTILHIMWWKQLFIYFTKSAVSLYIPNYSILNIPTGEKLDLRSWTEFFVLFFRE